MKFIINIIFLAALIAVVCARPKYETNLEHIRLNSDGHPESFKFDFDTSDGSSHAAEGHLKDIGTDDEALVVTGSYRFVAIDGKTYDIKYTARTDNRVKPIIPIERDEK